MILIDSDYVILCTHISDTRREDSIFLYVYFNFNFTLFEIKSLVLTFEFKNYIGISVLFLCNWRRIWCQIDFIQIQEHRNLSFWMVIMWKTEISEVPLEFIIKVNALFMHNSTVIFLLRTWFQSTTTWICLEEVVVFKWTMLSIVQMYRLLCVTI